MNSTPAATSPLASMIAKRIENLQHRRSQSEIARAAGLKSPNMLTMIKLGTAKLPLDRVAALAKALEVDEHQLMRLALRQFYSEEVIQVIEHSVAGQTPAADESILPVELMAELNRIGIEAVAGRIRANLLWHDVSTSRKLLRGLSTWTDTVEEGLTSLMGEMDEILSRLNTMGVGRP